MRHTAAVVQFRAVDDDQRVIEGIANTDDIDAYNTILEPEGAVYKLPMPVLNQHRAAEPIGHVTEAKVGKSGIRVKVKIAPAGIAEYIDVAWAQIKAGLVAGLSVGFDPIEEVFDKTFNGFRFPKWKWLELSTVTIPANESATMSSVRSADRALLAAIGKRESSGAVRLNPPASGPTQGHPMKNLKEHIASLIARRDANEKRLDEIIQKCADENRSRDAAEQEEYDNLQAEAKQLERDIEDFSKREKTMAARAVPVVPQPNGTDPEKEGKELRQGRIAIEVKPLAPKGIGMARVAIAMIRAGGNAYTARELAKQHWKDNPEVSEYIRTVIEAGDTTTSGWASQLVPAAQQMADEFIELLRAATVIGRIPGLREVPFNIAVPLQTGGGTYGFVGEGAPKPVTKPTYGSTTLRFEKVAGIIVITEELARFSSPSAEVLVRNELVNGLTEFLDTIFVGNTPAIANVQPAGIRNGITPVPASGTTANAFRSQFNQIMQNMITNKRNPARLVLLMSSGMAMSLSSMINSLGQQEFPSVNAQGGTYLGIPIVVSQALGTNIVLIDPNEILHAAEPAIRIDVSREASVEMDDSPVAGETSPVTQITTYKSFWQNNLVGIRGEQFNTWKVARTSAVEYISGADYKPPVS